MLGYRPTKMKNNPYLQFTSVPLTDSYIPNTLDNNPYLAMLQEIQNPFPQQIPVNYHKSGESYGLPERYSIVGSPSNLDNRAKAVLDAIARNEGTYKTGYSTQYGYRNKNQDITNMTLSQVMEQQRNNIKAAGSSAVGRYQMLLKTLQEESRLMGLDPNKTRFTPEVQDSIMLHRLNRLRGYDKWASGKLSDDQFISNLSKEFSSVVNPVTGKGYYDNHAKPFRLIY